MRSAESGIRTNGCCCKSKSYALDQAGLSVQDFERDIRNETARTLLQGILTGALMVTIGLSILAHLGFVTGGTAGLALIVSYATGWNVGIVFFLINLPFYGLAITRLGWAFTIKTFLAVACLSVLTALQPEYFTLGAVNPLVGAVLGGVLIGYGLLALYRHRASLGGVGILAIYLQDRLGWKAGPNPQLRKHRAYWLY